MMRLSQPAVFRSESTWKELMERNEKLAIEVGRLRSDIRNLRKKNSSLLTWKLKIDQFHQKDLPILYDKSTQTESIAVLLESSNPYKTPLRMKTISQQNSLTTDTNYSHSHNTERDNNSSFEIQENISLPEEESTFTSIKTKPKNRRRSSSIFSLPLQPIENNSYISPKQLAMTKGLEEKIRHESTSENEQQQTLKLPQGDRRKNSDHDRYARPLVTPDRPSRSVKKVVTYKEPSLRVKVRKGFQFFKFSDTPLHNDIQIEDQQVQPTSDGRYTYSSIDALQEEEKESENVIHVDNEEFAMYYSHHPTYYSP